MNLDMLRSDCRRRSQPLAMLARRQGKTLNAPLKRLDRALGLYYDDGTVVDGINRG